MGVRAKFICQSITKSKHWDASKGDIHSIRLTPVSSGSEENRAFYAETPGGEIKLDTLNDAAGKQFELGKAYYIDFTPAE